jgi:hypothetical protein
VFADVNFAYSTSSHASDLDFGELDPYAKAQLSDAWSALAEVLVQRLERGSDLDVPSRSRIDFDLERLFVAYDPSDAFRFQLGEINSGIIEWNEREQLPRFLQTPIDVPSIAKRQEQGGAWPLHWIAAWASGRAPGSAGFRYGIGIGEGRGRSRDDTSLTGPNSAAGLLSLSFTPNAVPGWEIGGSALLDAIPAAEGTYREIDRTLSTSYVHGPIEFRAEWSRMEHRPRAGGRTHVTKGWYALLSLRLPRTLQQLRPYLLIDQLDVANDEPYLADVSDQRAWSAGVRWDLTRHVVMKVDFQSQRARAPESERRIRAQIAVGF